jgi:predicted RNA-binding protein YlxR (DUF448 family)
VSAKKPKRQKHIPQRTCIGCHEIMPKRSLIRIVSGPDGVKIDLTGKAHGRGAYLHDERSCWVRGLKGALAHALRTEIDEQELAGLRSFMGGLTDHEKENDSVIGKEEPKEL